MNLMRYVLDTDGNPQPEPDLLAWAQWMGTYSHSVVKREQVGPRVRVSTIFLGAPSDISADGPPLLWESMVFGGKLDGERERYASRADALDGHARLVARVRASQ
jgi:hypothetical protein